MKKSLKKSMAAGAIAISVSMLLGCGKQSSSGGDPGNALVECFGVGTQGDKSLLMTKTMCESLPYTQEQALTDESYVHCYGVAAAGKNGCATKTNSCAGSAKMNRDPSAWVSLPKSVCENLEGSSTSPGDSST